MTGKILRALQKSLTRLKFFWKIFLPSHGWVCGGVRVGLLTGSISYSPEFTQQTSKKDVELESLVCALKIATVTTIWYTIQSFLYHLKIKPRHISVAVGFQFHCKPFGRFLLFFSCSPCLPFPLPTLMLFQKSLGGSHFLANLFSFSSCKVSRVVRIKFCVLSLSLSLFLFLLSHFCLYLDFG